MINSKIINDSEHKKWIDYIKNKKDTIIFVIFDQYKKVFKEIFLLKTTKKKWDKNKDFISKKYEKVFKKYEFQFYWN